MATDNHIGDRNPDSGQRRRVTRVRAELPVAIAFSDGQKLPARVVDVSLGGLYLRADRVPEYGEALTVIVRLDEGADWVLLPARVRWFSRGGFGVEFEELSEEQRRALSIFVTRAA